MYTTVTTTLINVDSRGYNKPVGRFKDSSIHIKFMY